MSEFPKEFKECPICQHNETLARLAWEEMVAEGRVGESSKDLPVATRREGIPLIDPKRGLQLSAKILALSLDRCAKCGFEYCTNAEIVTGAVQMGAPPGGGQFPPGFPQKSNLTS